MVRNIALERAVDIAVRDVRLGNSSQFGAVPDHSSLKLRICREAGIIPDCLNSVKVEVMPVNKVPGGVAAALGNQVRCIDKSAPPGSQTPDTYSTGAQDDLMLIHVCSTTQPLFPSTGFGVGMKVDANGNYAIIAATAFVNEPGARSMMNNGNGSGGNGSGGGTGGGSVGASGSSN
ncbi:MAG: pilus assembly protein [Boseongicola sp.]|nr:pilus assembly protein [Boseongicola sp.]